MESFWKSLEATQVAVWVESSSWAYPFLSTAQMIGLALLFGCIVALNLRLMGLGRSLPLALLARYLLTWVWTGFSIYALSGSLLFMSNAADLVGSSAFRIKLILIIFAGINALFFHVRTYHYAVEVDPAQHDIPRASFVAALVSICIWVGVIAADRMIAYVG